MQVAIDNAKRSFDIDLADEIARIKNDMDIPKNGYPSFWFGIRKDFNKKRENPDLICPMNYVYKWKPKRERSSLSTIPTIDFLTEAKPKTHKTNKKVEELIGKYSGNLYEVKGKRRARKTSGVNPKDMMDDLIFLELDFYDLIEDIRKITLSTNYQYLMLWLIKRAFKMDEYEHYENSIHMTRLAKNKAIVMKILYQLNPKCFLQCFKEKHEDE